MPTIIATAAIGLAAYVLGAQVQRRARRRRAIMRREIPAPTLVLCRRSGARN
jgi:hypothetical protein